MSGKVTALAMRHRLVWFIHLQAGGLNKGLEKSTPVCSMMHSCPQPLALPAVGHWDTCPLDFQQILSSLWNCTKSDSDFVWLRNLSLQTFSSLWHAAAVVYMMYFVSFLCSKLFLLRPSIVPGTILRFELPRLRFELVHNIARVTNNFDWLIDCDWLHGWTFLLMSKCGFCF